MTGLVYAVVTDWQAGTQLGRRVELTNFFGRREHGA